MHLLNQIFWIRCRLKYSHWMTRSKRVIELGSLNINGSIRDYFDCKDYVGIDWRPGKDVDLVSLAHEAPFEPESFDTVVSASMLEHDAHWQQSIGKMVEVMKKDGILMLSWGTALNSPHEFKAADDGKFHPLKAQRVLNYLQHSGLYIHEFYYEQRFLKEAGIPLWNPHYGLGEAILVAFKDKGCARGGRIIDPVIDEDKI